jgi:hypothetical protein
MATDLFGAPIFESTRAKQPALFPARHWFELGYMDCWRGAHRQRLRVPDAYQYGYEAALRDRQQDDRDSNCDADRAWRQNVAVSNVAE